MVGWAELAERALAHPMRVAARNGNATRTAWAAAAARPWPSLHSLRTSETKIPAFIAYLTAVSPLPLADPVTPAVAASPRCRTVGRGPRRTGRTGLAWPARTAARERPGGTASASR